MSAPARRPDSRRWPAPGWALALVLLVGLGGCLGGGAVQDAEIALSVLPPMAVAPADLDNGRAADGAAGVDAGADAPAGPGPATIAPTEAPMAGLAPAALEASVPAPLAPALLAAQRACAREGGRLVPSGVSGGRMICLFDTRDGGQRCQARGDCEGVCLARSNTCAPIRPLFGCHEVLDARGARVTECLQ